MHVLRDKAIATAPVVLDVRVVSGTGGGPDKTILNSPQFLDQTRYRMLCGYMHPPGDRGFERLRRSASRLKVPLISITDRGPWDWQVILRLLEICRRERVRIWHGHDYKSNLLGLILRRFWPMHLVTTVHGWVAQTRRMSLYFSIDRLCLPHYQRILCVSADLQAQCIAAGVPARRCVLLENAIDLRQYARSCSIEEAKARLGFPPGRFLIGAVGRLATEKGFDVLIRAVGQLVRSGTDVSLMIVGDGHERSALAALIDSLGLRDRVHLLGYRSDTVRLFEPMDVFALSSFREGLPNVLLEAMAMQVPVVATRVGGVPQAICDQQSGLLVDSGSVDALASAIVRLKADSNLCVRLSEAARGTIEQRYSFASRMEKLETLYTELLTDDHRNIN